MGIETPQKTQDKINPITETPKNTFQKFIDGLKNAPKNILEMVNKLINNSKTVDEAIKTAQDEIKLPPEVKEKVLDTTTISIEKENEDDFSIKIQELEKQIQLIDNNFKLPKFFPENTYGADLETNKKINEQTIENLELLNNIKTNPQEYSNDPEIQEFLKTLPYDVWEENYIKSLDIKQYKALLKSFSSKRFFGHSFPRVSLKNGYLCNGSYKGGEGFSLERENGPAINFVCENKELKKNSFYPGGDGNVFFPAEVILRNKAFVRLPYETSQDNEHYKSTTEFRCYGELTLDPEKDSSLNRIDLSLGVLFLDKSKNYSDEELKESKQYGKIVYYDSSKGENKQSKLIEFLQDIGFDSEDKKIGFDDKNLPRLTTTINTTESYEIGGNEINLISSKVTNKESETISEPKNEISIKLQKIIDEYLIKKSEIKELNGKGITHREATLEDNIKFPTNSSGKIHLISELERDFSDKLKVLSKPEVDQIDKETILNLVSINLSVITYSKLLNNRFLEIITPDERMNILKKHIENGAKNKFTDPEYGNYTEHISQVFDIPENYIKKMLV